MSNREAADYWCANLGPHPAYLKKSVGKVDEYIFATDFATFTVRIVHKFNDQRDRLSSYMHRTGVTPHSTWNLRKAFDSSHFPE